MSPAEGCLQFQAPPASCTRTFSHKGLQKVFVQLANSSSTPVLRDVQRSTKVPARIPARAAQALRSPLAASGLCRHGPLAAVSVPQHRLRTTLFVASRPQARHHEDHDQGRGVEECGGASWRCNPFDDVACAFAYGLAPTAQVQEKPFVTIMSSDPWTRCDSARLKPCARLQQADGNAPQAETPRPIFLYRQHSRRGSGRGISNR